MERAAHRRQSSLEINPCPEFLLFIFHPGEEYSTKFLTRRNPPRGPIPYSFNPFSYTLIDKNSISFNCSLPADVLWGSFVTHSFLPHMRDKRTPKDVCGEAISTAVNALSFTSGHLLTVLGLFTNEVDRFPSQFHILFIHFKK